MGVLARRANLGQVVSLAPLDLDFQDWLGLQDRLVCLVKLAQMDQRG